MNSAVGEALPQAHAQHQLRRRRSVEQHQQIKDQQLLIEELKKQDGWAKIDDSKALSLISLMHIIIYIFFKQKTVIKYF